MSKSFKHYQVIETDGMTADKLQAVLNDATNGFPEKQIYHVIGSKIILSFDSILNEKGRMEAKVARMFSDGIIDSNTGKLV
ncbi:hypothetical protein H9650_11475 [Psychrobacillus sp. Sa2BUA9]|uniref:Uncharacterized protein n=1 Tax=Psychrobacillus faecigallinarum TaxID=2762235 RepID=A0ABR8RAG0_9BACI|nr:hypothetical protein [Psychrobacillus faecigallinarum]MBD7944736.1 hypothetical protein [Psychrobacillus faecigallinarum]